MASPTSPSLPLLLLLFLCFLSLSSKTHLAIAASTLSANQSLSGTQTIISKGGNFELGFFSPPGNPSNFYIAIWYKKVSQKTVVWVANRDRPVSSSSSSELRISEDGNLVLLDGSKNLSWSTNLTSLASNSTEAEILDTGNLVLRDGSDPTSVLWQSIDHPTDTWLPGAKVGLNKVTKVNQILTSWRNSEDPGSGIYSLELDPNGSSQYFVLWNRSKEFWTSGTWNGQIFSLVPEMTSNYIYSFQYISNATESYFTYSVKDNSIISRFVMDVSGQIKQYTWLENSQQWLLFWSQPRTQCEVYSFCGPFGSCDQNALPFCNCLTGFEKASPREWNLSDPSGGCVRRTQLNCGNGSSTGAKKDGFLTMPNMVLPDNPTSLNVGAVEDCESSCLSDCSCTAYSYNGACTVWNGSNGKLLNLQHLTAGSGNTLYLRLAASELESSKSNKGVTIGAVVGGVAGVAAIIGVVLLLVWRCKRKRLIDALKVVEGTLVPFRYTDLQRVTKNFSDKLGGGGFGSVFKGTLPDSTIIAVKKLEGVSQGEKQFRTEVSTIGTIQHVNLVRLHGFCSEGTKRLLVYEYMPRGSIDTQLFQNNQVVLDWRTRYQIALGIARGLHYLHEKCRDCIIHCDIKPENILLDASFCPKVADFGLAKLMGRDFSRVLTTMRGTRGYLAPEWISGVAITVKADVYSYGMMLFEIISGRRNSEHSEDGKGGFFPIWAAHCVVKDEILSILDPRLESDTDMEELSRTCRVACWCVQDDEDHRPPMGQVVQILEGVLDVNVPPIPRSLQILADSPEGMLYFSEMSSNQSSQVKSNVSTGSQAKSMTSISSRD